MKNFISVITPVFNREEMVEEYVSSVLAALYLPHIYILGNKVFHNKKYPKR